MSTGQRCCRCRVTNAANAPGKSRSDPGYHTSSHTGACPILRIGVPLSDRGYVREQVRQRTLSLSHNSRLRHAGHAATASTPVDALAVCDSRAPLPWPRWLKTVAEHSHQDPAGRRPVWMHSRSRRASPACGRSPCGAAYNPVAWGQTNKSRARANGAANEGPQPANEDCLVKRA